MDFFDHFHNIKNFVQVDHFENIMKNRLISSSCHSRKYGLVWKYADGLKIFFKWQKCMRIDAGLSC